MTSKETKHQTLTGYIDTFIGEHREAISSSIREMEYFNISAADFRKNLSTST